jgi:RimJ/RimL family protein N-acetyltransferase
MSQLNDRVYDTNVGKTGVSLDRIRKLFHHSSKATLGEGSVFEVGSGEDFYWFTSGMDVPFFNQVSLYSQSVDVLAEALKPLYEKNVVHAVYLGGAALAHAEALKLRGYVNKGATPLMAYSLDPAVDHHQLREGLSFVRVATEADLKICSDLLISAFGIPEETVWTYIAPTLSREDSYRYYILDNGVPVSTAFFVKTGTFLGCFDVATPAEHQRKGYGDELMRSVFTTHAAIGDELVVLQASDAGQPLYRRLGFQFVEYIQSWHMESVERMRRFTHRELQLGDYKLRPLAQSDMELLLPYYNDPDVVKWMLMPDPFEEKDFADQIKRWSELQAAGIGINWVIEQDGVPQGGIACHHTDWKFKRTEIGYMAFPPSRGKGVIPTVLRSLVEFLFEEYEFERIEIRTDIQNNSSRKAALKGGFTFEGELRRNFLNKGEVADDAIFSIIKSDLER